MPASALTTASPSRTQRRQERNRAALVAAARRLFAQQGFDHTTIAEIASEADLGFGTFYRYFEDKEAALDAVLDEARQESATVIQASENETLPPAEALVALSERLLRSVRRNRDIGVIISQMEPSRRPPFPTMLTEALEAIVARGMAAGDFAAGDEKLVARMLMGAHLMLFFPLEDASPQDAAIAALQSFELRAVGAQSGAAPSTAKDAARTAKRRTTTRR